MKITARFYLILFGFGTFVFTPAALAKTALAVIRGTAEGSPITGTVTFTQNSAGLKINIALTHVPPGKHGLHIHEKGDCAEKGNAAGGHFNPDGSPHGYLPKDGFSKAHAGDFGNIEIGTEGSGKLETIFPGLTLDQGRYGILGRSVILHEKEDTFGQPTGNAGGRIACGVIRESPQE